MGYRKGILRVQILFLASLISGLINPGYTCTRIFHKDAQSALVGRTMDWDESIPTQFRVYPGGMERSGNVREGLPLKWTSKYGSLVVASYEDAIASEGMNEAGLSVHLLTLSDSDYGQRKANIPGLSLRMWAQYYLDQFGSVAEAIEAARNPDYQLEILYLPKMDKYVRLHMALEDAQGHAAVIEYIQGKPVIYTQDDNSVLTNDPAYDFHLQNLQQYQGFGGDKPLPGMNNAMDRFVRASWYNKYLPLASTADEAVYSMLSIIHNVAKPYSKDSERTRWYVIADLTNKVYYYASTASLTVVKITMDKFDLSTKARVMMLDIEKHPELTGEVSSKFLPL